MNTSYKVDAVKRCKINKMSIKSSYTQHFNNTAMQKKTDR